jgi:FkbM family methyltransferase
MNFSELDLILKYNFISQAPCLVDVGGHEGGVSLAFAKKGWSVIAFEPEEINRKEFLKNLSGFDKVVCIPKAISNVEGEKIPFYVSKEHYGIHSIKPFHDTHEFAYEVETTTLNKALQAYNIHSIAFLKIDIEGADFLALQGLDFQQYKPEVVMVEFMDERSKINFNYTHPDMTNYMQSQGYTCFVSEWGKIKEYGRKGINSEPHQWIRCVPYPLPKEAKPEWGNLIFVLEKDKSKFEKHLKYYLKSLETNNKAKFINNIKLLIKKIPGIQRMINLIKGR